ncbi:unnamed protein product [Protopolystoma xenopodis]|uniref:Uncharacterized protein n=1 Tax=Protopolystoma xenopodis TaxID=117903 RepID=A0A448WHA6_9PLAT|nr:unnamed protein product [Protopolystoma xenopodis]
MPQATFASTAQASRRRSQLKSVSIAFFSTGSPSKIGAFVAPALSIGSTADSAKETAEPASLGRGWRRAQSNGCGSSTRPRALEAGSNEHFCSAPRALHQVHLPHQLDATSCNYHCNLDADTAAVVRLLLSHSRIHICSLCCRHIAGPPKCDCRRAEVVDVFAFRSGLDGGVILDPTGFEPGQASATTHGLGAELVTSEPRDRESIRVDELECLWTKVKYASLVTLHELSWPRKHRKYAFISQKYALKSVAKPSKRQDHFTNSLQLTHMVEELIAHGFGRLGSAKIWSRRLIEFCHYQMTRPHQSSQRDSTPDHGCHGEWITTPHGHCRLTSYFRIADYLEKSAYLQSCFTCLVRNCATTSAIASSRDYSVLFLPQAS